MILTLHIGTTTDTCQILSDVILGFGRRWTQNALRELSTIDTPGPTAAPSIHPTSQQSPGFRQHVQMHQLIVAHH